MQPGVLKTIKDVRFNGADFTQDETCELLAQLVATAPELKHIALHSQLTARRIIGRVITVDIAYCTAEIKEEPTSENMGSVLIMTNPRDGGRKSLVCSVPTSKRIKNQKVLLNYHATVPLPDSSEKEVY